MSAISGFCEKCSKFRKRYCDGDRNTCRSILFDTIEALQQKIEQLKEQINTAKIGWDTYKTYSEQLEQQTAESNKIIETQQQEIEKLKATLADWKYNTKCDADHIAALTAERDELAGRLMLLNDGIKQVIKWLTPHPSDGSRAVEKARLHLITLIGGKEDDK